MNSLLLLTAIITAWPTAAQTIEQVAPSAKERESLIAEVREKALAYTESLPNFLCTQFTRRSSAQVPQQQEPSWKLLDTLTIRLTYFGKKEDYRVIQVNGKNANKSLGQVGGWTSQGDFGSMLRGIFLPKSEAAFQWEQWDTWNGRRVAVLSYAIDQAHSEFRSASRKFLSKSSSNWAARGRIHVDVETRQTLLVTVESVDMPRQSPTSKVELLLAYGFQKIGGAEYLLPSQSVAVVTAGNQLLKLDTEFTGYRKFSADTEINYMTPPGDKTTGKQ